MVRWDIFCTVVDNFGDIGTCWRLAQQLANEYEADVRLWVDNLSSFACLCPSIEVGKAQQCFGAVEIRHWTIGFPIVDVADVVIEAFACQLPAVYIAAMASRKVAPVWINLEYLSAEGWVEECHQLPSPQLRSPIKKYFFFPGVTEKTGGVLRESDLLVKRAAFGRSAAADFWSRLENSAVALDTKSNVVFDQTNVAARIVEPPTDNELRISLFCYNNSALPDLLQYWSNGAVAVRVLTLPGAATDQVAIWIGKRLSPGDKVSRGSLTVQALPFLPQPDYDKLLWACDVNFVRGEDSFVRAQWAQRPFVWQIYPQTENSHYIKLDAFLSRYLGDFERADVVRRCWQAWNRIGDMGAAWRDFVENRPWIQQHCKDWASELDRAGNLADNLVRFVCGK